MSRTSIRELKKQSRTLLMGKHGPLAFVTLLMSVFHLVLLYAIDYAFPTLGSVFSYVLYLVCSVLANMVYYILLSGLYRLYLNLCRGWAWKPGDLFSAFSNRPEPVAIYSLLPFALQSIPGNLAVWILFRYLVSFSFSDIATYLLLLVIVGIVTVWLQLGLSMVLYLYCDAPWKTARNLVRESWKLMKGEKLRLFSLFLSFLGLNLLSLLSFGIGMLFVQPYVYVTETLFYMDLTKNRSEF